MKRNTFVNLCFGVLALMIIIQGIQLVSSSDLSVMKGNCIDLPQQYSAIACNFNSYITPSGTRTSVTTPMSGGTVDW
jgi:hypothetical protein